MPTREDSPRPADVERRDADGRWLARLVADDGRVVLLELSPDVATREQALAALRELRRVTRQRPPSR